MSNITELIKNIRNSIYGKDVRESIAGAIEQCYEDASKNGNANMEVTEARGTFSTLNNRLNNSDSVKANRTELEATKSNLQNQIDSLASGSPKGNYATVDALVTANPETGVYVVTENGHIYSWTKDAESAIDLGVYQATQVAGQSLSFDKLNANLFDNSLILGKITKPYETQNDAFRNGGISFFIDLRKLNLNIATNINIKVECDFISLNNHIKNVYIKNRLTGFNKSVTDTNSSDAFSITTYNVTHLSFESDNTNNGQRIYAEAIVYPTVDQNNIPFEFLITNLSIYINNNLVNIDDIRVYSEATGNVELINICNNENLLDIFSSLTITRDNLFNKNDDSMLKENYLVNNTGNNSTNNNFNTVVIPLKANKTYFFKYNDTYESTTTGAFVIKSYETSNTVLLGENLTQVDGGVIFTTQNTDCELWKSYRKSIVNTEDIVLLENEHDTGFSDFNENGCIDNINGFEIRDNQARKEITNNLLNPLKDKTLLVIGDSISDNRLTNYCTIHYYDYLEMNEKMKITMDGCNGTGYTKGYSDYLSIPQRINNRTEKSFDYITIFAGTNDWWEGNVQIGAKGDTENTFYAYLKETYDLLVNKYPLANVLIATPIRRSTNSETNSSGNTLEEYCNAILDMAHEYGFATIDLYNQSGLNPQIEINKTTYFYDNTHPNNTGQLKLYPKFRQGLLNS